MRRQFTSVAATSGIILLALLGSITPAAAAARPSVHATSQTPTPQPPVLDSFSAKPVHANSWTISLGPNTKPQGTDAQSDIGPGYCKGQFFAPQRYSEGFTWGVYTNCTQSVPQQISVNVSVCDRIGGPDDYVCRQIAGRKGNLQVGYSARFPVDVACTPGVTRVYQPLAYNVYVNGRTYPDVYGNYQSIPCYYKP